MDELSCDEDLGADGDFDQTLLRYQAELARGVRALQRGIEIRQKLLELFKRDTSEA